MILVSSCLLGNNVKYNGGSNPCEIIIKHKDCGHFIPICPETFGKLPCPRPPAEIKNGTGSDVLGGKARILDKDGKDVTAEFKSGAEICVQLLTKHHITAAILKERSPSCGSKLIYDGTFSSSRIPGQGVTAALLTRAGVPIYSEEDMTEELLNTLIAKD